MRSSKICTTTTILGALFVFVACAVDDSGILDGDIDGSLMAGSAGMSSGGSAGVPGGSSSVTGAGMAGAATGGSAGAFNPQGGTGAGGSSGTSGFGSLVGGGNQNGGNQNGGNQNGGNQNGGNQNGGRAGNQNGGNQNAGGGRGGSGGASQAGAGGASVTYAQAAQIIGTRCGNCHRSGGRRPNLSNGTSLYTTLTGTSVGQCGNDRLVTPSDTGNSALIEMMTARCGNFRMPQGCNANPCIPNSDLTVLNAWINAGAPGP